MLGNEIQPPVPDHSHQPGALHTRDLQLGKRIVLYSVIGFVGAVFGAALVYVPTAFVLGALFAGASVAVILSRPFLGLLLYTAIFVLRPAEMYPILAPLRLERVLGVLVLAAIALGQYRKHGRLSFDASRQTLLLAGFVFCVVLSVPFAYWRKAAVDGLIEFAKICGFYLMIVHLVDSKKRFRIFVWLLGSLMFYLAVTSLRMYFAGDFIFTQGVERAAGASSAGGDPNTLGTTMAATIPVFLLLAKNRGRNWEQGLSVGFVLTMLATMALTGSRASLLGFMAALVHLWYRSRRRVLYGLLGLGAIVIGFSILPDQYKDRYQTVTEAELDASSQTRLTAWRHGMSMVLSRPLFGVGIGCFGIANAADFGLWLKSHSLYVQVPSETGLVGAAVFFCFLVAMLRLNRSTTAQLRKQKDAWKFERCVLDGIFAGLVTLLVAGVFGHSLLRPTWYIYAALGLAAYRVHMDYLRASVSSRREESNHA